MDVDEMRRAVPDDSIRLTAGRIACAWCGMSAPRPASAEEFRDIDVTSHAGRVLSTSRVEMTRCVGCADRRADADVLVASHPTLAGAHGPDKALGMAEGVLAALALLGRPPVAEEISDNDLGLLVRHLSLPGRSLAWRHQATRGQANPYPFAHVTLTARAQLRTAYAAMLAEQVAQQSPPVRLAPAVGEGCLLCGVDGVSMPAGQVQRHGGREVATIAVWRNLTAPTEALGGPSSPESITGQVCPPCSAALDSVGSVGPSALERALVAHLSRSGRTADAERVQAAISGGGLVGLVGWAGLPAPRVANREPWAHLGTGSV